VARGDDPQRGGYAFRGSWPVSLRLRTLAAPSLMLIERLLHHCHIVNMQGKRSA
jgi:hypothetical protein